MIMDNDKEIRRVKRVKRGILLYYILLLIPILLLVLVFRPISNPKEGDCSRIVVTLVGYGYSKHKDIHFKISENDNMYYLNRVNQPDSVFTALDTLVGKRIVLYPVNHWSLLNPRGRVNHVARVTNEDGSKIIYSTF